MKTGKQLCKWASIFVLIFIGLICSGQRIMAQEPPSQDIAVSMYVLTSVGGNTGVECVVDNPDTSEVDPDLRRGCTAFNEEDYPDLEQQPYPYDTNPVTVSIESDYLPDVVPREMGPDGHHPLAVKSQAIAARTYAYCAIHAGDEVGNGSDNYWGGCSREINNSNSFQVFIPFYYDTLSAAEQQIIQDATAEQLYMLDPEYTERGPIFAEFSADAYLQTVAGDYDYLKSVEDPISYEPAILDTILQTNAHQRGMSQGGANRWAYGNSSQYGTLTPWPVAWNDHCQILAHYYTGIDIGEYAEGWFQPATPENRWNPLWHNVPSEIDTSEYDDIDVTLVLQNTSAWDWGVDGSVALAWQWTQSGASPYDNDNDAWQIVTYNLPLEKGNTITRTVSITVPADIGNYDLHWDFALTDETLFWFGSLIYGG